MNWFWADTGLSAEECKQIMDVGRAALAPATIYGDRLDVGEIRQGQTCFFPSNETPELQPTFQKVVNTFCNVVREAWGSTIKVVHPLQLAHYKEGDFYDWHFDMDTVDVPEPRHFSATIELSEPNSYEGGGLEFLGMPENSPEKLQGRMILFPSFAVHRARKVTKGERFSLVLWADSDLFDPKPPPAKSSIILPGQQAGGPGHNPRDLINIKVLDRLP